MFTGIDRKEVAMPSNRFWFTSQYSHTHVYVEQTTYTHSDGMPSSEATLLATVCRNGNRYDARIHLPAPSLIRGFKSLEAAETAVVNYLSTHDHAPKRQLP